ncbi:hypothetical protein D9M71_508500 [compost metagenome]
MPVEDQPAGDGGEVGARLFDGGRVDARGEQLAEGLRRGVLGVRPVAQLPLHVLEQPAVMVAEEEAELDGGHGKWTGYK